jgi:tRNA(Arg) A34 adenosine deaminase TadA
LCHAGNLARRDLIKAGAAAILGVSGVGGKQAGGSGVVSKHIGTGQNPMAQALAEAEAAAKRGEVPVGAVLVDGASGAVLAADGNRIEELADPTAHAEMLVLRKAAGKRGVVRLEDCDLYVSLEPCAMCAAAVSFARIRRLYFGAYDAKGGAVEHGPRFFQQPTCHHRPDVYGGIEEARAGALLRAFFKERR